MQLERRSNDTSPGPGSVATVIASAARALKTECEPEPPSRWLKKNCKNNAKRLGSLRNSGDEKRRAVKMSCRETGPLELQVATNVLTRSKLGSWRPSTAKAILEKEAPALSAPRSK